MLDPRYAYMSAYLKGEEPKVVSSGHIERLSRASSIGDGLGVIRETEVGNYLESFPIKNFEELEAALWRYLSERISYLQSFRFLPRDMAKVCRTYATKYDVSNIKATVQRLVTNEKSPLMPLGIMHEDGLLDELEQVQDVTTIAEILTRSKLGDYAHIVRECEIGAFAKAKLTFEARLDGQFYKNMLDMARRIRDGAVLFKAVGLVIDLTNLQIVCRATAQSLGGEVADALIPGGYILAESSLRDLFSLKLADMPRRLQEEQYRGVVNEIVTNFDRTRSLASIEETVDKHRFTVLRGMLAPRALSPTVIAWYLILKEMEARNLRLVFKAISDNIPVADVRDYLVF